MAEKPIVIENYACYSQGMDLETLRGCGITLLSHNDWTVDQEEMRRYLDEAHALGIRVTPYVSPEKAWFVGSKERLESFVRKNQATSLPYYQAVDPRSHPEWILIDGFGRPTPRYGSYERDDPEDREVKWGIWVAHGQKYQNLEDPNPWSWYMCSSAEGYLEAVERGVRALMDMGFDGVFIDNTYTRRLAVCHGAELGIHKHRAPGDNTDKTYARCAEHIYHVVKSYGEEKIVLLNSGREEIYDRVRDGCMIESYIATAETGERTHNWEKILEWAHDLSGEPKHGRFVTALSYVQPTARHTSKENCFFTYACALLSAFKWTATCPRLDQVRLLYRARLIEPRGEMENLGKLWYRHYDKGMVVVNPDLHREFETWLPSAVRHPVELYTGRRLAVKDGKALCWVPSDSGRVVVDLGDALINHLAECAVNLCRVALAIERHPDRAMYTIPTDWGKTWEDAATAASEGAEFLKGIAAAREPNSAFASEQDRLLALLRNICAWHEGAAAPDDPFGSALQMADEHAGRAASLITGLEVSFLHDRPPLRRGAESEIRLSLTNHGTAGCHIDVVQVDLPEGWEAVPPCLNVKRRLEAGDRLELAVRVQIPPDSHLPQDRLLVKASAVARSDSRGVIPCGNTCYAREVGDAGGGGESGASSPTGELEMPAR